MSKLHAVGGVMKLSAASTTQPPKKTVQKAGAKGRGLLRGCFQGPLQLHLHRVLWGREKAYTSLSRSRQETCSGVVMLTHLLWPEWLGHNKEALESCCALGAVGAGAQLRPQKGWLPRAARLSPGFRWSCSAPAPRATSLLHNYVVPGHIPRRYG